MHIPSLFSFFAASFKSLSLCNSSNKKLIRVCDLNAHALPIFLLCGKFQIIFLKTVEVAEDANLLCYMCKAKFLSKSKVSKSSNETLIKFCDLYAHALLLVGYQY